MKKPFIIIIDHQDSFTFNLFHLFYEAGARVEVIENNQKSLDLLQQKNPDALVLSPGPGSVLKDSDKKMTPKIIETYLSKIPILGICLGHQMLGHMLKGEIEYIPPSHGKKESLKIIKKERLFKNLPDQIKGMRYHSQIIKKDSLPSEWITATTKEGEIMAFENPNQKIYGVQFHPESIGTSEGGSIAKNFLALI